MPPDATRELTLRRVELGDPVAQTLVADLNAELSALYPEEGANHFSLTDEQVAPGRGIFLVAFETGGDIPGGSEALGCGALRKLDERRGELKRMYTTPMARRRGVAHELLAELEAEARRLGLKELVLETGVRQQEALSLYRSTGWVDIERYGEYATSPLSVCLGKTL